MRTTLTTSTFTLPVCIIAGSVLWLLPEVGNPLLWGGWFVAIATTLLWAELTNSETLMRVRSQMISTTFFAGMLLLPDLHMGSYASWLPFTLLGSYACLFKLFDVQRAEGYVFYSFFLLSIAILLSPPLLWLIPIYWWSMGFYFQKLTPRSWIASIFGLITPIILWGLWMGVDGWLSNEERTLLPIVTSQIASIFSASTHFDLHYWQQIFNTPACNISASDWRLLTTTGWFLIFSVVSTSHFHFNALQNKLKVRTYLQTLLLVEVVLWFCLIFMADESTPLMQLLMLTSAPFIAHYFTLSRGWMSNLLFAIGLISYIAILIFNYNSTWILSLIFS